MPVISAVPNEDDLSLTLTAEYRASAQDVWELWNDPRKLERWWGPPTFPATFTELDLTAGGRAAYFMTGPEGEKHGGQWDITAATPTSTIEFDDWFADENGTRNTAMPMTRMTVSIDETDGLTRMVVRGQFENAAEMKQLIEMGMAEGMTEAAGQIDAILAR